MREVIYPRGKRPRAFFGMAFMSLMYAGTGQADDERVTDEGVSDLPRSIVATSPAGKPLDLLLTREELRRIVSQYELRTGEVLTVPIDQDEVVVTGPRELAPMHDVSQDVCRGIAAPFWSLMHPINAWRILVPIPPRSPPQKKSNRRRQTRVRTPLGACAGCGRYMPKRETGAPRAHPGPLQRLAIAGQRARPCRNSSRCRPVRRAWAAALRVPRP
jgi:hypothetical protein